MSAVADRTELTFASALKRHRLLVVSLVFVVVCVAILCVLPRGQWSPDCDAKLIQVLNIRWDHGLRYSVPYPGKPWDPEMRAIPLGIPYYDVRGGELFIVWPLLFAIVSRVLYNAIGYYGLFVVPLACGAGCVYATGRLAEALRVGAGTWAALIAAFATPVLIYSVLFWEHTPALLLTIVSVILLVRYLQLGGVARIAGSAASMAFAASAIRGDVYLYGMALFPAAMLFMSWKERRQLVTWGSLSAVAGSVPGFALNFIANGHLLPSNQVKSTPPPSLAYVREAGPWLIAHFLAGNDISHALGGLFALAGGLVLVAYYWAKDSVRALLLVASIALFTLSAVLIALTNDGRFLGHFHGWLAISPILGLGFLVSRAEWARERGVRVVVAAALVYCVLLVGAIGLTYPNGFSADINPEWGPRYWLELFPPMAALTALALPDLVRSLASPLHRRVVVGAAALLGITSVGLELRGVQTVHEGITFKRQLKAGFENIVADAAGAPVVVDIAWLPEMSPDLLTHALIFDGDLLRADVFRYWAPTVYREGMREFTLVSDKPADAHPYFTYTDLASGVRARAIKDEPYGNLHAIRARLEVPESSDLRLDE